MTVTVTDRGVCVPKNMFFFLSRKERYPKRDNEGLINHSFPSKSIRLYKIILILFLFRVVPPFFMGGPPRVDQP